MKQSWKRSPQEDGIERACILKAIEYLGVCKCVGGKMGRLQIR
jgi:hypothetical protein